MKMPYHLNRSLPNTGVSLKLSMFSGKTFHSIFELTRSSVNPTYFSFFFFFQSRCFGKGVEDSHSMGMGQKKAWPSRIVCLHIIHMDCVYSLFFLRQELLPIVTATIS